MTLLVAYQTVSIVK